MKTQTTSDTVTPQRQPESLSETVCSICAGRPRSSQHQQSDGKTSLATIYILQLPTLFHSELSQEQTAGPLHKSYQFLAIFQQNDNHVYQHVIISKRSNVPGNFGGRLCCLLPAAILQTCPVGSSPTCGWLVDCGWHDRSIKQMWKKGPRSPIVHPWHGHKWLQTLLRALSLENVLNFSSNSFSVVKSAHHKAVVET